MEYESRFDRFRNQPRASAWRESSDPGSGVLYDLGSHLIDQALVLFGLPDSITADVRTERDFGEADDAFDIRMHYGASRVTLAANPAFYENVRDAIREDAKLEVAAEDARTTIRIIEIPLESSRNATSVRMTPRDPTPSSDRSIP